MKFLHGRHGAQSVTDDATDIISHSMGAGGGSAGGTLVTAIVSGFALLFSAISLYQTVLRQAALQIYVPPVIHYVRSAE